MADDATTRQQASGSLPSAVMMPMLDILQSIPVLSFLPALVLALVALVPGAGGEASSWGPADVRQDVRRVQVAVLVHAERLPLGEPRVAVLGRVGVA